MQIRAFSVVGFQAVNAVDESSLRQPQQLLLMVYLLIVFRGLAQG